MQYRAYEPYGVTQNVAMDGTAKTITLANPCSDIDGVINVVVVGTATAFILLDGTVPTTSNAKPMVAQSDQNFSMPSGKLAVKLIGAAGSTVYVTQGRGV